ncbi:hypothetical protein B9Z19DRAFT_1140983 [Tuber borchii]|uniref:Uncharacterized protein n=1 Tax=Tuber borchii TaxID=42251 RepID=A0A2T6ZTL5_TUBBO|nr:hypothetical protein B9Z19DRAFT_1140983 [Tuber borchii]
MEGSPKIDFEKLAQKMNYKSAGVANARFHQIKRAVIKASDAAATAAPGSSPPPSPAKKVEKAEKVKKEAVEENGVVKKRGRGRPRKVKVAPASAPSQPVGGEGGRGEKAFGEDFGGGGAPGAGEGVIDPRVLRVGTGDGVDEEEEEETEIEGEKGGRVGFGL